jgi:hypothetical protein
MLVLLLAPSARQRHAQTADTSLSAGMLKNALLSQPCTRFSPNRTRRNQRSQVDNKSFNLTWGDDLGRRSLEVANVLLLRTYFRCVFLSACLLGHPPCSQEPAIASLFLPQSIQQHSRPLPGIEPATVSAVAPATTPSDTSTKSRVPKLGDNGGTEAI